MNIDLSQLQMILNDNFNEVIGKIDELRDDVEYHELNEIIDLVYVSIGTNGYDAIDDIFVSYTGKHYMKVFIKNHFVEISIDKIVSVTSFPDKESYIATNWIQINNNILREKKIGRILE